MTQVDSKAVVIAIDGPSASGKSSVSQLVADALGYGHVDTGSMYRAFTWKVLEDGIDPHDQKSVLALLRNVRYECDLVENENGGKRLRNRLDGTDPGNAIREPRIDLNTSIVAALPEVREVMVRKQRELTCCGDLVMEGRDIGTVVFPNTPYKFYLFADPEVRARRRAADQQAMGANVEVQSVSKSMVERDQRDSTRTVAPLKIAEDATQIDTSLTTAQEAADVVLKHVRSKYLKQG